MASSCHSRLIVIDGFMGAGKSTTAQLLTHELLQAGIEPHLVLEGVRPHPVKVGHVSSIGDYREESTRKWTEFTRSALRKTQVTVFDGQVLHFSVDEMLLLDGEEQQIRDHVSTILAVAKPLNPVLVLLAQDSFEEAFDSVVAGRGRHWLGIQVARKASTAFCLKRGLGGLPGLKSLYKRYWAIVQGIVADLGVPIVRVDLSGDRESALAALGSRAMDAGRLASAPRGGCRPRQGDLIAFGRGDLQSMAAFGDVMDVEGDLWIRFNPRLENLEGLHQVGEISGNLDIRGNGRLQSLGGLRGLERVKGRLSIVDTPLQSLLGLRRLRSIGGLVVRQNRHLRTTQGTEQLREAGSIVFRANPSLVSLDGLRGVTTTRNDVILNELPQLRSLTGLESLQEIHGNLEISYNDRLEGLEGLKSLRVVAGEVRIINNPKLGSLEGLSGLTKIGRLTISGCGPMRADRIPDSGLTDA